MGGRERCGVGGGGVGGEVEWGGSNKPARNHRLNVALKLRQVAQESLHAVGSDSVAVGPGPGAVLSVVQLGPGALIRLVEPRLFPDQRDPGVHPEVDQNHTTVGNEGRTRTL